MKRVLMYGVVAALVAGFALVGPASAQTVVRESSCTDTFGSNVITYDCSFNVKDYVVGTPVTFNLNWTCTGACGPVLSFGMRGKGFSPEGVSGHMVGGKRLPNGLSLTFVFDSLKTTGSGSVGNAHFKMNINVDDGSGSMKSVPCDFDAHLMQ